MGRFCLVSLLLLSGVLFAQSTNSSDIPTMHVCNEKRPASSGPCAVAPRPVTKFNPVYPEKARQSHREGKIVLGLIVGKDGATHDLRVVKGLDDDLNQAATGAVARWKFEPATYEGAPVAVEIYVDVNFRLVGRTANTAEIHNLYTDANEAYNRHRYETAVNLARRINTMAPQGNVAWNLLGISLLALNELDAAATALETAIKNDPVSAYAYNNLGRVYWRQRKYEEATAQFHKQIVINPQDHYAHANLGMMLRDQKKCSEAMPELEAALALTPNHTEALLAEGECDLDLGNRAKGISELEQATSVSSTPGIWNSAAYSLAKRGIELERAEKWSDTSLMIESARLHSVSLERLAPEQMGGVLALAHYWDTRGWIYFQRGDYANAQTYTAAAWWLHPLPVIGNHLGQIYEKTGPTETAIRTYAMAIAAADRPSRSSIDPNDAADAKQRLAQLAGHDANIPSLIARGRTDLESMDAISIPNAAGSSGSADFILLVGASEKPLLVRQISRNASLETFTAVLQSARVPLRIPEAAAVEIPLRGTLTCKSDDGQCRFSLLSSEAAFNLASKEDAFDSSLSTEATAADPRIYNSSAIGISIVMPDEWTLLKEEPGTFTQPHIATFNKPGTAAFFLLVREHLEGTPKLYKELLERGLSQNAELERNGEESVTRDGLAGTRWNVTWKEGGLVYSGVMEFFTVGDDHYRMTALAPKEIYDRYATAFENMLRSAQFPMLRADPRMLEGTK